MRRLRRPSRGTFDFVAILAVTVPIACVPLINAVETVRGAIQMKRDWTDISGPACPIVERPSPVSRGRHPPRSFTYQGVTFTRQFGHVDCAAIPDGPFWAPTSKNFPVCQFTSPSVVWVTVAGRTTLFEPGPVRRTTVTVRDGQVRCVVGGWFKLG